jgi:hypothetical protein
LELVQKLESMNRGERILANLAGSKAPKTLTVFAPDMNAADVDANELYSTTYE